MDDMHTYCNINAAVCNTSSFFLSDHLAGGLPWTWVFLGGHSVCSILFYVKTCKTFIKLGQRMLNITKIWKWIVHNFSVVFMRLNWFAFIPLNGMSLNCNLPRINFFLKCSDSWGKIIFANKKNTKTQKRICLPSKECTQITAVISNPWKVNAQTLKKKWIDKPLRGLHLKVY